MNQFGAPLELAQSHYWTFSVKWHPNSLCIEYCVYVVMIVSSFLFFPLQFWEGSEIGRATTRAEAKGENITCVMRIFLAITGC